MATTGPVARIGHALAFDSARGRTILFGGDTGGLVRDTWSWNGTSWQQLSPATSPPARRFHAMVYDSVRDRMVLFGGHRVGGYYDDTWEFDGTTWQQRAVSGPPGWDHYGAAYDLERQRTVLTYNTGSQRVTWEWDGTTWTQARPSVTPPGIWQAPLVYDAARARCVLAGSQNGSSVLEVWEYDGASWMQRSPSGSPAGRNEHQAVYDLIRGCLVLFGGYLPTNVPLNDTWEYRSGSIATFDSFGAGCLGSRGVPGLAGLPGSRPVIGDVLRVKIDTLPLVWTPTFMYLGFSNTSLSGIPLPLDLGVAAMPGCWLLQSADIFLPIQNAGGSASFLLPLPDDQGLLGIPFYLQAAVVDRNANAPGFIWSNGGAARIGS